MTFTIGVIGLGIMGGAFAKNLLDAGFPVIGHDILEDRMQAIKALGGKSANSAGEVAEHADIVITSLPSISAFHDVMTGEGGIASGAKDSLIVIECSTMPVEDKQAAHEALEAVGTILLDCPISGTGSQAPLKDLVIYVSGDQAASDRCKPVFQGFTRLDKYVGSFGNGSKLKFIANHLVTINNVASAEAMVLGMKAGLDPQVIFDVISAGAANSRVFELRAPMMVKDEYLPATMKNDIYQKDLKVIGEFASGLECPTPLFSACVDFYRATMARGLGEEDTAAVCRIYEEMAGIKR
jgi:3-hydroxyisobutyrate dehydrogenase-like beta-hydroxyacid dehydrogenase